MRTPFFSALLAALMLHVVGLAVVSLDWQVWRVSSALPQADTPVLVAVVPVPEPASLPEPTPELVTPPGPVAMPPADAAPEPMPATPVMSTPMLPPQDVVPTPLKRMRPRPQPTLAQAQTFRATPTRARLPRPSLPAPVLPDEPLGSTGSGTAGPPSPLAAPVPELPQNPGPGGGTDVGHRSAHGDVPVTPGSSTGGGGARASTGGGTSGGTGAGRGGASGSGGVTARPIDCDRVKPLYPVSARWQGIEGTVLLKMRLTEQGRVEDVQVERSAGHPDLDQSAMEAVRRWRCEPTRSGGEPVAILVTLPVVFKLQ